MGLLERRGHDIACSTFCIFGRFHMGKDYWLKFPFNFLCCKILMNWGLLEIYSPNEFA